MRPLRLKMTAFGSYTGTVNLDFENGLNNNNFFLIHGATGSGKTTILDAICYALYGKTSGGERDDKMMIATRASDDITTEVAFDFELGGKIYSVCRIPSPKKGIKRTAQLYVDGRLQEDNLSDVNDYITRLIGFNIEQFRQVVVLPQGKFRNFLSASAGKKAELLNAIFNADFYKEIEDGLKTKATIAQSIYDELLNRQNGLINNAREVGNVNRKEDIPLLMEQINKNLDEAKNLRIELEKTFKQALEDWKVGEILNKDFENLDIAKKNLQISKLALEKFSSELTIAKVEYDRRKGEENLRRELDNKISELNKIRTVIVEFNSKKSELSKALEAEKVAQENLHKLEHRQKKFELRMNELKEQEAQLQNADVEFERAKKFLGDAKERDERSQEINLLKKNLATKNNNLVNAEKNLNAARIELDRLRLLQKNGTASRLAATLKDGEPCPVCGATRHPQPAFSEDIIPTDDEIDRAENLLKRRQADKDSADREVAKIDSEIKTKSESLKKFIEVPKTSEVQQSFDKAKSASDELKKRRQSIKSGEHYVNENKSAIETARRDVEAKTKLTANLRGIVEQQQKQISTEYADNPEKLDQDLSAIQKNKDDLDTAFKIAEEKFRRLDNQKSAQEGKIQAAEKSLNDASAKVDGKVKPDIEKLKNNFDAVQKLKDDAVANVAKLEKDLVQLNKIEDNLNSLEFSIQLAETGYQIWKKLSDVALGTRSKISFQRYYLGAMFQSVIVEANNRLDKMSSGRYQFRGNKHKLSHQKLEGINLEIFDAYTDKTRPVETLSGGESFLASLSLALGLATVVQNISGGIRLDTIFIDEGFGSLDSETLDNAINTLSELQDGGRLVGIISHVEELKNRIPVRLEVTKGKFGSSAHFVN